MCKDEILLYCSAQFLQGSNATLSESIVAIESALLQHRELVDLQVLLVTVG